MARTEVKYLFPLKFWQQTPDYDVQYNAAQQRFMDLNEQLDQKDMMGVDVDLLGFTVNGVPEAFKGSDSPWDEVGSYGNPKAALETAQFYGARGSYSAEDLEDFINGKGVVVVEEMQRLGFKRPSPESGRWVKLKKGERYVDPEVAAQRDRLYGTDVHEVTGKEADRLRGLIAVDNTATKPGDTYSVEVGRQGLIYVSKDWEMFPRQPGVWISQFYMHGHINREQDGFNLAARNIVIPGSQSKDLSFVHVTAQTPDQRQQDFVWPVSTYGSVLSDLAVNLRRKVTGR